jgi:hypothetical protein
MIELRLRDAVSIAKEHAVIWRAVAGILRSKDVGIRAGSRIAYTYD